jgi:glucarate dehydratase
MTATRLDPPGSRIEEIRTTIFNLRLRAPYHWAAGLYHGSTKVLVEVRTADGMVGFGEASNWRHAAIIEGEIAPRIIGEPATNLRRCWNLAVPPVEAMHNTEGADLIRAYGAIEIALWDLRGKMLGMPIHRLLGGAARTRVPFTEYFAAREPNGSEGGEVSAEEIGAYCLRAVEEWGSSCFEGKVGWQDLETDLAVVRAVRDAIGPERALKLDANGGWTLDTARHALRAMADLSIDNVEDPVFQFEDMASLRLSTPIPFSTHVPDLRAAIRLGAPDSFVLNATALGGIERTLRFVAACEGFGRGFSFYSGDAGIGVAAYLQMAAADPYLGRASQSLLRWYANDIIVGGPFSPCEGHLDVPDGPGLGVDVDRQALERANADFQAHGEVAQAAAKDGTAGYARPPLY